ncbi:MAG: bifunctional nuclease family protein [Rectinemataceae bacterium]
MIEGGKVEGQTFVEAEIWTVAQTDQGNVVLVRPKGSELAVPIFIGQLETQSILIGMGGVDVPRPLSHDLVLSVVSSLHAEVTRIEIHDLREGTFYARLVLRAEDRDLVVDARPSDAIGIAVRAGCPVFIAESVIEEAGISVNLVAGLQVGEAEARAPSTGSESASDARSPGFGIVVPASSEAAILRLRAELESAVADEDYERAASIRDKLRELES